MKHLLFVSWVAVSSEEQAKEDEGKFSLSSQTEQNRQFVEELQNHYSGYTGTIVKTLSVIGSRSIVELSEACKVFAEYAEIVRLIKDKEIDAIICRSRDRMGRTDSLITTIERLCLQNDVVLLPRMSPPRTLDVVQLRESEDTGFIMAIEGQIAQRQIRWLQAQRDSGMKTRIEKRKLFPATPNWGYFYTYDANTGQVIGIDCDPSVRATIRMILLDMFVHRRMSHIAIISELNRRQITTAQNKPFTLSSIAHLIRSVDIYAGYLIYNRGKNSRKDLIRVKGDHPSIITEDELQLILQEKASRKTFKMPTRKAFSGIVICEASNKSMSYSNNIRLENGQYVRRLSCPHCGKKHAIHESRISAVVCEALDVLRDTLSVEDLLQRDPINQIRIQQQSERIDRSMRNIDRQKERLLQLFLNSNEDDVGAIGQELLTKQMRQLESQRSSLIQEQKTLAEEIERLQNHENSVTRLEAIKGQVEDIKRWITEEPTRANQIFHQTLRVIVGKHPTKKRAVIRQVIFI